MKLYSTEFNDGDKIPVKYTCDGENISPPLFISDVPEDAQSLVLVMDDPDAPSGTFTHWVLTNIHPSIKEIPEDTVPNDAVVGITSFGSPGYGGPCPPSGKHRYIFKVYALDEVISLPEELESEEVGELIESRIIEQAELLGVYSRQDK